MKTLLFCRLTTTLTHLTLQTKTDLVLSKYWAQRNEYRNQVRPLKRFPHVGHEDYVESPLKAVDNAYVRVYIYS